MSTKPAASGDHSSKPQILVECTTQANHALGSQALSDLKSSPSATLENEEASRPSYVRSSRPSSVPVSARTVAPSWRPSVFRWSSLAGLAALVFVVLQVAAAGAVLAASDGARVSDWRYAPSVYLAVLVVSRLFHLRINTSANSVVTFLRQLATKLWRWQPSRRVW
jgi:hypothetical protein